MNTYQKLKGIFKIKELEQRNYIITINNKSYAYNQQVLNTVFANSFDRFIKTNFDMLKQFVYSENDKLKHMFNNNILDNRFTNDLTIQKYLSIYHLENSEMIGQSKVETKQANLNETTSNTDNKDYTNYVNNAKQNKNDSLTKSKNDTNVINLSFERVENIRQILLNNISIYDIIYNDITAFCLELINNIFDVIVI